MWCVKVYFQKKRETVAAWHELALFWGSREKADSFAQDYIARTDRPALVIFR
jgi:hypothetical protein